MKLKLSAAVVLAGLTMVVSVAAQEPSSAGPPDKQKLSYAVGTHMGQVLLQVSTNVNVSIAAHAAQDVLEGNPTMIKESEIAPTLNQARTGKMSDQERAKFSYAAGMRMAMLFKRTGEDIDPKVAGQGIQDALQGRSKMTEPEMETLFTQAENYERAQKSLSDKTVGTGFLAQNARKPGVQTLSDGLQYQVIQNGTGPYAKPDDLIFIKFRGTFINGVEFHQHPHFLTRISGCMQGWKDALSRMKVGSEWRIFVPSNLAFGHEGNSYYGIGPDTTVIYDLQLVSIAPPDGNYEISSGLGHGLDVGDTNADQ